MLNEKIRECRENNNLKQEEIAKFLQVARSTYTRWEIGDRIPDAYTVKQLANYFDVTTDYLLDNEKKQLPICKETAVIKKAMQNVDETTRKRMLETLKVAFPEAFDDYEWALKILKEQDSQLFASLKEGSNELSRNDVITMAKALKNGGK